jgi:hypothetical protein
VLAGSKSVVGIVGTFPERTGLPDSLSRDCNRNVLSGGLLHFVAAFEVVVLDDVVCLGCGSRRSEFAIGSIWDGAIWVRTTVKSDWRGQPLPWDSRQVVRGDD